MGAIDAILNLACVLLWLNWRSQKFSKPAGLSGITLVTTLKSAGPTASRLWLSLGILSGVLVVRALIYYVLGSAVNWTAGLHFGAVSLPFRSDRFVRILLYSLLSFGVWLCGLWAWLVLLSVVNRDLPDNNPQQRFVRVQLGRVERWPSALKLLLPAMVASIAWIVANPLLHKAGLVPTTVSEWQLIGQALLVAFATCLFWKFLIVGLLFIHLVNSYLYLGNHPLWQFISHASNQLLKPFRMLPLRLGKVDLAPLAGIAIILAVSEAVATWLPKIFQWL